MMTTTMSNKNFKPIINALMFGGQVFCGYPHRRHKKTRHKKDNTKSIILTRILDKEHKRIVLSAKSKKYV